MSESIVEILKRLSQMLHWLGHYHESNQLVALAVRLQEWDITDAEQLRNCKITQKKG